MFEGERSKAARYEKLHPGTGVSEAQAAERMDRMEIRGRDYGSRSRIFLMPEMPWHRKEKADA